jgi:hypothetical protein
MSDYRYKSQYRSGRSGSWNIPDQNGYWHEWNGAEVIHALIHQEDHFEVPGIEVKLERLIQVVGAISDHLKVDLTEVLDLHELNYHVKVNA